MSSPAFSSTLATPRASVRRGSLRSLLPGARWLSPVALVVLWQLASTTGLLPEKTLESPLGILSTAWELTQEGQLPQALAVSLRRAAEGFVLGAAIALIAGTFAGLNRAGNAVIDPPMQMLRTVPLFGLIPLFILWFGIGETPKVLLVALGVVFPLYLNTDRRAPGDRPRALRGRRLAAAEPLAAAAPRGRARRAAPRWSGCASRSASRGSR